MNLLNNEKFNPFRLVEYKLMKIIAFIFTSLSMSVNVFAQVVKTDTLYYDYRWMKTNLENVSYYKVVNQDKNNNPVGIVKEYYPTGEIKTSGELLFLDREDDNNSKWKGKKTGFYKSGKKAFEQIYTQDGQRNGATLNWDEKTNEIRYEFDFKNNDIQELNSNSGSSIYEELTELFSKTTSDTVTNGNLKVIKFKNDFEAYNLFKNEKFANLWQFNNNHDLVTSGAICNDIYAAIKDLESNSFNLVVIEDKKTSAVYAEYRMLKYALKNHPFVYIFQVSTTNSNQGVLYMHSNISTWY